MNSLEMLVSNMDLLSMYFFSESRTPHTHTVGLQSEEKHPVLLILALLMQWMSAEPTVNDQACRTLGSCVPPVTFYCVCHLNHLPSECKTQFLNFFNCTWN